VNIEFLYDEDCPSHEDALARLRDVLSAENVVTPITVIEVASVEQAEQLRFVGSPTIRIDGRDIDPPPASTPYRLACRAYCQPDGRISPLPPVELIRQSVRIHLSKTT
jgi:hypothetical protein